MNPAEPLLPKAMLETLSEFKSSSTVEDTFGNGYSTFVKEGTACPSVGIYRCKGEAIKICDVEYDGKWKRRFLIREPSKVYNISITAESYQQPKSDDSVLLLLGLGRPWRKPDQAEPEKECYIFVIGIITKTSDSDTPKVDPRP